MHAILTNKHAGATVPPLLAPAPTAFVGAAAAAAAHIGALIAVEVNDMSGKVAAAAVTAVAIVMGPPSPPGGGAKGKHAAAASRCGTAS